MGAVKELWMDEIEADCEMFAMGEIDQYEFRERMERRLFDRDEIDEFIYEIEQDRGHEEANWFRRLVGMVARAIGWRGSAHP